MCWELRGSRRPSRSDERACPRNLCFSLWSALPLAANQRTLFRSCKYIRNDVTVFAGPSLRNFRVSKIPASNYLASSPLLHAYSRMHAVFLRVPRAITLPGTSLEFHPVLLLLLLLLPNFLLTPSRERGRKFHRLTFFFSSPPFGSKRKSKNFPNEFFIFQFPFILRDLSLFLFGCISYEKKNPFHFSFFTFPFVHLKMRNEHASYRSNPIVNPPNNRAITYYSISLFRPKPVFDNDNSAKFRIESVKV